MDVVHALGPDCEQRDDCLLAPTCVRRIGVRPVFQVHAGGLPSTHDRVERSKCHVRHTLQEPMCPRPERLPWMHPRWLHPPRVPVIEVITKPSLLVVLIELSETPIRIPNLAAWLLVVQGSGRHGLLQAVNLSLAQEVRNNQRQSLPREPNEQRLLPTARQPPAPIPLLPEYRAVERQDAILPPAPKSEFRLCRPREGRDETPGRLLPRPNLLVRLRHQTEAWRCVGRWLEVHDAPAKRVLQHLRQSQPRALSHDGAHTEQAGAAKAKRLS
mmetsp:Transcript_23666/g.60193  ORF Transcript_23666/g.60193 Transcript_23666/m.60193 type:complete len:271 (-) Transcript_23666:462-1274(-)